MKWQHIPKKNRKGKSETYRYQAPKLKSGSIGPSVTMKVQTSGNTEEKRTPPKYVTQDYSIYLFFHQ